MHTSMRSIHTVHSCRDRRRRRPTKISTKIEFGIKQIENAHIQTGFELYLLNGRDMVFIFLHPKMQSYLLLVSHPTADNNNSTRYFTSINTQPWQVRLFKTTTMVYPFQWNAVVLLEVMKRQTSSSSIDGAENSLSSSRL